MALNATTIKNSFKAKLDALTFDETSSEDDVKNAYAEAMAEWVIETIQTARLTIPSGTIITTGSAVTQTQSVPGIVEGGLS